MLTVPPGPVVTAAEMRAAEAAVIATGVSVDTLMERAGAAIAESVWRFGGGRETLFLCGPGNNGGDGYVAARILSERGLDVRLAALRPPKAPAAIQARSGWSGPIEPLSTAPIAPVVVDCLFGTGMGRPLEDEIAAALARHFHRGALRIAVDIPSGIGTDDGSMQGFEKVRHPAQLTLALGALKPAHVLDPGAGCCGIIRVLDIGVPLLSDVTVGPFEKPPASPNAAEHKFSRPVVVVSGEMPGAAQLSVSAASRIAGYTVLATDSILPNRISAIVQRPFPDVIGDPRFKTYVIGPGLGRSDAARAILERLLDSELSLVIDADALHLLGDLGLERVKSRRGETILTPHEGEFKALFGALPGSKIDRVRAACAMSGATIIYKGSDTLIASPRHPYKVQLVQSASPWLATAGTGDVLAGLAGAFMSYVETPEAAALAAVELHGAVARDVGPGLIADDMPRHIGATLKRNGYE